MNDNYTVLHLHTWFSLLDSATNYQAYIDKAVSLGQKAIAFTEHGNCFNWVAKKLACDKAGIKFLFGVEVYLTEKLFWDGESGEQTKLRDNFHTILLARNMDGIREINELVSRSSCEDHFYYKPRISFQEFFGISKNVIKLSACLASPLNKLPVSHSLYERLVKSYDYLEIQPHRHPDQVAFNRHLADLSQQYGIPLVATTDTHSLDAYKAESRSIMQLAKHIEFADEDTFDLTYKSYDELVQMFRDQDAIPEPLWMEAIQNTNRIADEIESFDLDTSFKYPVLYGEKDRDVLLERIDQGLQEKLKSGAIPPEQEQAYRDAIQEEMRVFDKLDMSAFMLFMSELVTWCKTHGIPVGPGRGSVGGSRIAYLIDIIDLNPERWQTIFYRFCNESRLEIGDIDTDYAPNDREKVYDYIINRFGQEKAAFILAIGTVKAKGCIDEICRALASRWDRENCHPLKEFDKILKRIKDEGVTYEIGRSEWEPMLSLFDSKTGEMLNSYLSQDTPRNQLLKKLRDEYTRLKKENEEISAKNPWRGEIAKEIKKQIEPIDEAAKKAGNPGTEKYRTAFLEHPDYKALCKKYPEVFQYFEGLLDVAISQSMHPAGIVASPITLRDNYGTFISDGKEILQIDMDCVHDSGLVKYDILGLKNIAIIRDAFELAGKPYPKTHEIDWDDQAVWKDMLRSPVGIFQMESAFAFSLLKKFEPKNIYEMALLNAGTRPAGESYRDELFARKVHHNPSPLLDDLLGNSLGYLCVAGDQLVETPDGRVPIKDIKAGDFVYTKDGIAEVSKTMKTGRKETVTVCAAGVQIKCTPDHKLLTHKGWIPAGNIKPGDSVALRVNMCSNKSYDRRKLRFLAYLLGDGGIADRNTIMFCNTNIDVVMDYKSCVESFDNCTCSVLERETRVNHFPIYYTFAKQIVRSHTKEKACLTYLKELGSKHDKDENGNCGCLAKDKFIPDFVFSLSRECISEFLGAFTDTDCCIKQKRKDSENTVIAAYKTASQKMKDGLVNLIMRFGYTTNVVHDPKTDAWYVGVGNAKGYLRELYQYSHKIRATYRLEDLEAKRVISDSVFPADGLADWMKTLGCTGREVSRLRHVKYTSAGYLISLLFKHTNDTSLLGDFANPLLKFSRVVSVEDSGICDVYDITVPDGSNFACNGIITHNCFQEDTIRFLQEICGFSGSEADTVRRGIGRKKKEILDAAMPKILNGYCEKSTQPREVAEEEAKEFLKIIEDSSNYQFNYSHAVAYSMVGYLCAYLRYYYPYEFITAYLNNADNDDDVRDGSELAKLYGIQIVPPRFGISKDQYQFDREQHVIAKGLASVKYMNAAVSNELYELAQNHKPESFMDLLWLMSRETSLKSNQREILVKIDYFSEYGNAKELLRMLSVFQKFKDGEAKKVKKAGLSEGSVKLLLEHGTDKLKNGNTSDSITILDMRGLLLDLETEIRAQNIQDFDYKMKMQMQLDNLGYIDLTTGKPEDRRKLIITDIFPLRSKKTNEAWGYAVTTRSIGTGKEARLTVRSKMFDRLPLGKFDTIYAWDVGKERGYWYLNRYEKIY